MFGNMVKVAVASGVVSLAVSFGVHTAPATKAAQAPEEQFGVSAPAREQPGTIDVQAGSSVDFETNSVIWQERPGRKG